MDPELVRCGRVAGNGEWHAVVDHETCAGDIEIEGQLRCRLSPGVECRCEGRCNREVAFTSSGAQGAVFEKHLDVAEIFRVLAGDGGFVGKGVEGFAIADPGADQVIDVVASVKGLASSSLGHGVEVDLATKGIVDV